ncbi:T9SS type A sorting domain-containing protein [Pedobacter sp. MC2016-24]|uniref:T9SS type A sorting domain-containing protein n=1 Tax=Pedobacter sp. MC2016-24 TaxID=2780090 RepID=UPI00187E4B68|nr:T9SS type A sorting domain-containing protein [Pedobacter sp. MC2016-24]MBE9598704.1 T9SS type A sorting domain-containing protein [Pedobacter sp. MC2016-24]
MRILLIAIILFTCAPLWAQVNYVQNPDFEIYSSCPDDLNQVYKAYHWRNVRDSTMPFGVAYYNTCGNTMFDVGLHVPENTAFYQMPHSGNGMVGGHFFYDKTTPLPPSPLPTNFRHYLQGHLYKPLIAGKEYCVSFFVNSMEAAGYGHDKMGAYLDNGNINISTDTPGAEILTIVPQIYTNDILVDTGLWVKIEGSFIATGIEDHITIGNFFANDFVTNVVTNYRHGYYQYSAYLIDDVSVVETDLAANAGPDNFVEETKTVQIGRVNDTTAKAIDCKWYHKGALIDSGSVITVKAGAKGTIDTYTVVQTICGNVKADTVVIYTVGLGMKDVSSQQQFSVFPNPSDGIITITSTNTGKAIATVFDLTGRMILRQSITDTQAKLKLEEPSGIYILELRDEDGGIQRERLQIR